MGTLIVRHVMIDILIESRAVIAHGHILKLAEMTRYSAVGVSRHYTYQYIARCGDVKLLKYYIVLHRHC